jgi:phosphoribosylformimino-5-aminoimidazole carboxamide ribotide isomerase
MGSFIIYPAIDLRFGKVVRLKQGKVNQETIYSDDPHDAAQSWITQGAEWLHIVNLDGAFGENTHENEAAVLAIFSAGKSKVKIQLGGGLRSIEQVERALELGAARVVLGTAVIENPQFGIEVIKQFGPDKAAFGFDAIGQELMTRGWQSGSQVKMLALAESFAEAGAQTLIYTNIQKDGMQTGVDWENARLLAERTGLAVIASGGVAGLTDIARVRKAGLEGVIIGRALYEGNFTLKEALNVR